MINTNITNFRQKLFDLINQVVTFNSVLNITTKNGNAVVLSEEEYNNMAETVFLLSQPKLVNALKESINEPLDSMIDADTLDW